MIVKVGKIEFDGKSLDVYQSMDEPLFVVWDVALSFGYSNVSEIEKFCECDEIIKGETSEVIDGWKSTTLFLTEHGLYNVLSQSKNITARKWRKIIHEELIQLRKNKNFTVADQFEDWNEQLDTLYYDEEKNIMMQSVTVAGGDVVQVAFNLETV